VKHCLFPNNQGCTPLFQQYLSTLPASKRPGDS